MFATVPLESFPGRQVMLVVKNLPAHAGDERDAGWIPGSKQNPSHPIGLNHSDSGSGRSPGGENGNPLQYSCLGNPMGRGAWRAAVHGVMKSHICDYTAATKGVLVCQHIQSCSL